jgi:hypothetical protein
MRLFLPGDPGFDETLATPPPDWGRAAAADGQSYAFVVRPGSGGVAEAVTLEELEDFLDGGEYEERLQEIGDEPVIWTPY